MALPIPSPSANPARLLLVEDDPAASASLAEALSAHYEVQAVCGGLAALQAARRHPPALVIIGLHVAGADKLFLTQSLRADACVATLPIILLTASANRELLLRCLSAGASSFLLRPFDVTELLACVRVELELRAAPAGPRK